MEQKTFTAKGLKYLTFAFATLIIWQLVVLILNSYHGIDSGYAGYVSLMVIVVLSWVFFFWGLFTLWKGRTEIGKEHVDMVEKGIWLVIVFLAVSSFVSLSAGSASYQLSFFILNLMIFLVTLYLLHVLTTKGIKNLIWVAVFFFIVFDSLTTVLPYMVKLHYFYLNLMRIPTFLIPYTLIMLCYYKTYRRIEAESK